MSIATLRGASEQREVGKTSRRYLATAASQPLRPRFLLCFALLSTAVLQLPSLRMPLCVLVLFVLCKVYVRYTTRYRSPGPTLQTVISYKAHCASSVMLADAANTTQFNLTKRQATVS